MRRDATASWSHGQGIAAHADLGGKLGPDHLDKEDVKKSRRGPIVLRS
jgi:hypothetical protein